jgi:hypothetical protein
MFGLELGRDPYKWDFVQILSLFAIRYGDRNYDIWSNSTKHFSSGMKKISLEPYNIIFTSGQEILVSHYGLNC